MRVRRDRCAYLTEDSHINGSAMTSGGRDARAARRGVWSIAWLALVSSSRERNDFKFSRRVDS
jgi:hypothetical protein